MKKLKKKRSLRSRGFYIKLVRSISLSRKDITISKVFRNLLRTLGTARSFYRNFRSGREEGLVEALRGVELLGRDVK